MLFGMKMLKNRHKKSTKSCEIDYRSDVLNILYETYRIDPGGWGNSEQIRKKLKLSREQMNDIILALRERGFIETKFLDARALLRITTDGVAVLRE
jgi:hypothetical protein